MNSKNVILSIFLYYSIKSAIFPSFAHVITGPKPCIHIVTRSCYSPVLPMRNTYMQGPVNKQKNDDLALFAKESCAFVILKLLIRGHQSHK
jgi:hypothetical protein